MVDVAHLHLADLVLAGLFCQLLLQGIVRLVDLEQLLLHLALAQLAADPRPLLRTQVTATAAAVRAAMSAVSKAAICAVVISAKRAAVRLAACAVVKATI